MPLYVAKFPSRKDDYDVGLWEHLAHHSAIRGHPCSHDPGAGHWRKISHAAVATV